MPLSVAQQDETVSWSSSFFWLSWNALSAGGRLLTNQEWSIKGIREFLHGQVHFILEELPSQIWHSIPRDAMVPLLVIVVLFWPLLVSLLYAFMTASTWILWLLTSFLLGIIQVLYVTYQFVMITIDLCGLSILKSYSVARHWVLTYLLANKKKSRRRLWLERLKNAGSYENFLKIRIEPKDPQEVFLNNPNGDHLHHSPSTTNLQCSTTSARPKSTTSMGAQQHGVEAQQQQEQQRYPWTKQQQLAQNDPALPPLRAVPTRSNSFDGKTSMATTTVDSSHAVAFPLMDGGGGVFPRVRSCGAIASHLFSSSSSSLSDFWAAQPPKNPSASPTDNNNSASNNNSNKSICSWIDPVVSQELGERTAYLLVTTTERLLDARRQAEQYSQSSPSSNNSNNKSREQEEETWNRLKYLLSAVVKRNHLNLDNILVENARTVSFAGRYGLTSQSRQVIRAFYEQVQKCLDLLADGPSLTTPPAAVAVAAQGLHRQSSPPDDAEPLLLASAAADASNDGTNSPSSSTSSISLQLQDYQHEELSDRIRVLRKIKHNMGRTALMLSGGGAQAMYHVGIIRALIQSKLYQDISVISGTSGGSIIAAMCAGKTPDELFQQVCVPTVSTDFTRTGEQKRKNIRWFPSPMQMASYWFKHKYLVSSEEFRRTCEFYYGDMTFEEAFDRTGKHVCITVSASRTSASQRLLLNHISTPRVTLASAVAASCALPGVMTPAKLLTKNSVGALEPFEVDGVEWIDGSVQADLPFQRIATLFAVSNFIVSQTNFHIVPFLNKEHHPNDKSMYWRLFQTMEWDIRSRALKLSRLGLFPRIFGQDISKVFKQKYHGNLTIVPRFTTMQTFGLHALSNPTVEDMKNYIKYGEIATWPYLNAIRDMIRLEKVIDDCLNRLEHRMGALNPEWCYDDIESFTSSNHHNHYYHHYHHSAGYNHYYHHPPQPPLAPSSSSLRSLHNGGGGGGASTSLVSLSVPSAKVVKYATSSSRGPVATTTTTGSISLASTSRNGGGGGDDKILRRKAKKLEDENKALKEQLLQLQQLLAVQASGIATTTAVAAATTGPLEEPPPLPID